MKYIYPQYFESFTCINKDCKHNCCIGWEIDVDDETLDIYKSLDNDMAKRILNNICFENDPHFILDENERCPFLNEQNLCEVYMNLGEECLGDICASHPRFFNEFSDRIEAGLGLCCEEAARIILSDKPAFSFDGDEYKGEDEDFLLRSKIFKILQERDVPVKQRIENLFCKFEIENKPTDAQKEIEFLLSLERLDEQWTNRLNEALKLHKTADYDGFLKHIQPRMAEYEQLLVYFIYRYFLTAENRESIIKLCAFSFRIIYMLGAVAFTVIKEFTTEDQVELARLFSSEIEYSDENLQAVLDFLEKKY